MSDLSSRYEADRHARPAPGARGGRSRIARPAIGLAVLALVAAYIWFNSGHHGGAPGGPPMMPPADVTVSHPLVRDVPTTRGFLGQFSAIDQVDLRAQVGGTLEQIDFKDGQIVHKGDLLFLIDPRPYEIRLAEATAELATATAREKLAEAELYRAQELKKTSFGTAETVDQRLSDQNSANAAIATAQAAIRDAQLDLEYSHVTAPFTGRISNHLVSVGNIVTGSRGGVGATSTLLATLVSLDPIHLDFDMSENDFLTFQRAREHANGPLAAPVDISLGDEHRYDRHGVVDFIDNALDRSSGTIHARATVPNPGYFLVPGEFARIRMTIAPPAPAMLVPDSAVMVDQSQHLVLTVAPDGTVVPKPVEVGGLAGGLRIVRAGLDANDRVIILGLMHAIPGTKVAPHDGVIKFDPANDAEG